MHTPMNACVHVCAHVRVLSFSCTTCMAVPFPRRLNGMLCTCMWLIRTFIIRFHVVNIAYVFVCLCVCVFVSVCLLVCIVSVWLQLLSIQCTGN